MAWTIGAFRRPCAGCDDLTVSARNILGLLANTTVLVLAAQAMPVWGAKGLAILASFVVNFSLSHFVVFRARPTRTP
jgi:GtrA-like protein